MREVGRCPLWVRSGHCGVSGQFPLYSQKRTSLSAIAMSALCQKRTYALQQKSLFDQLVCPSDQRLRHVEAECPCRLAVNCEFKRGRLQDRQLRRFGALENPPSIDAGLPIGIGEACRVADQAA